MPDVRCKHHCPAGGRLAVLDVGPVDALGMGWRAARVVREEVTA